MIKCILLTTALIAALSGVHGVLQCPPQCTIITNPKPIPPVGVICGNPARAALIATTVFDTHYNHTNFRGFQVYTGTYKGTPMFAANTGLGGPAAAFLIEELAAYGVHTIIRLGSSDTPATVKDLKKVYVVTSEEGLYGLMRDYGFPSSMWGQKMPAHSDVIETLNKTAIALNGTVDAIFVPAYTIDGYYSFNFPSEVAYDPAAVNALAAQYDAGAGGADHIDRDMESGALYMVSQLRGIRQASVLQAVVKSTGGHEGTGTQGIPLVLETLSQLAANPPKPRSKDAVQEWETRVLKK